MLYSTNMADFGPFPSYRGCAGGHTTAMGKTHDRRYIVAVGDLVASRKLVHRSLQTVLTSANADSTTMLTPDAYALIRYNCEFLSIRLQP
jgi:hypothetical protein